MTLTEIKQIIQKNQSDLAFIIGNGINRFPNNPNALSWDDLLIQLWDKVSLRTLTRRPNGISTTEFYDILELENTQDMNLQKEVALLMSEWKPLPHHQLIADRIQKINAPILTTNFEDTLAKSIDLKMFRTEHEGFTDYYPWTTYHGQQLLKSPTDGFGVWYINGMIHYHRSIRLGLSHYMGSVERARNLIHKGNENRLFTEENISNWQGNKTWLHIIFNKSLFVFGLSLGESETFLRWLLIERIKYFKNFPDRKHKGWYIYPKNEMDEGKKFFLERVGFEVIEASGFEEIYEAIWL